MELELICLARNEPPNAHEFARHQSTKKRVFQHFSAIVDLQLRCLAIQM